MADALSGFRAKEAPHNSVTPGTTGTMGPALASIEEKTSPPRVAERTRAVYARCLSQRACDQSAADVPRAFSPVDLGDTPAALATTFDQLFGRRCPHAETEKEGALPPLCPSSQAVVDWYLASHGRVRPPLRIPLLEKSHKTLGDRHVVQFALARSYREMGHPGRAAQWAQAAIRTSPGWTLPYLELMAIQNQTGQRVQAAQTQALLANLIHKANVNHINDLPSS